MLYLLKCVFGENNLKHEDMKFAIVEHALIYVNILQVIDDSHLDGPFFSCLTNV